MIHRDMVVANFNISCAHDSNRGLCPGKEHVEDAQIENLGQQFSAYFDGLHFESMLVGELSVVL